MLASSASVCMCMHPGQFFYTGWGVMDADIEVFVHLRSVLPSPDIHVFAIGNAFGYSTIVLGLLFARQGTGSVDVIDAETEAGCNHIGSLLTRTIANASKLNVALSIGL